MTPRVSLFAVLNVSMLVTAIPAFVSIRLLLWG